MKNYKSIICVVAAVCLLGTAAFCGFRIYHYYAEVDEQTEAFEEIAEMVEQAPTDETVPDDAPVSEGEDVLAKYQELYLQNEDMVGWISIAGTTINYPVMQSRNNPNFYLKHNFEKEYSDLGTPYVQENCDIAESDNLVIYGHHIKGGKMFGALEDYKSKSFYEEHKNIQFDTLTEQAEYEIVAVFKTVAYSSEGFRYYDFVDVENEEDFTADFLNAINMKYLPDQVFIEYNGTWGMDTLTETELPRGWMVVQSLATVDATTFDMYLANMRTMIMEQLFQADVVIFNRCDDSTDKGKYRRNVKALNRKAQLVYERADGSLDEREEELPFDISGDELEITDADYAIWYMDCLDNPKKYEGKKVSFLALVYNPDKLKKGIFVPGRFAMTCCVEDITFIGFKCKYPDEDKIPHKSWIHITAQIKVEFAREYKGKGPVLYPISITPAEKPEDELVYFS